MLNGTIIVPIAPFTVVGQIVAGGTLSLTQPQTPTCSARSSRHPLPFAVPHDARLGLAINMLEYFLHECRFQHAECAFVCRPYPLATGQCRVPISTATEHPAHHQAVCSIVIMHAWRCATSRRGHREV